MINNFHIDLALNVIYEAFMEDDIRLYYALRGKKVNIHENPARDQQGREQYDRAIYEGFAPLHEYWECKQDRIYGTTGNVFLEIPHPHSIATHFLIKTFRPHALRWDSYQRILDAYPHRQAGDFGRAEGILIKEEALNELNELYP